MTTIYTPEEIAAVLDEGRALEAEITAVMAEVAAALAPYEHPGIVLYPEHCDALLAATHSENFTYQVGEPRNRGSSTSTPIAKWRACNAKNRRAIARVRKEIAALLAHPDYGYYRDMNGERYTLAKAQAEHAAAMGKLAPAPTIYVVSHEHPHRGQLMCSLTEPYAQRMVENLRKIGCEPHVTPALPSPVQPAYTKRVGEYDPTTRQYPAYVAIDGGSEQLVGSAWSAGAADRLADDYAFHYFADRHTPEVAATIAVGMSKADKAPEPYCFFHPDAADHDTQHCPKLDEPGFGAPSYSVFN